MQLYLQTEPYYAFRFSKVWMWNEFPFRKDLGGQDTGIDLVAQTTHGAYWAIQCKCYQESATINKAEVDSFLTTAGRSFMNDNGITTKFEHCLWISTTNHWGGNAEEAIKNHTPTVSRISLYHLQNSNVDWDKLEQGLSGEQSRKPKHQPMEHQKKAIDAAMEYYKTADRGKLIMACGTGKTFTSLRIAEGIAGQARNNGGEGLVLFLVPSIALLGQTLEEWTANASQPINAICICSDPEVSKRKEKNEDIDSFSVVDLALPASTDVPTILKQLEQAKGDAGMTVVFSTYQSIDVIARASSPRPVGHPSPNGEGTGVRMFDLIICDEAHRTTGVTLSNEDESAFVKVHNNDFIAAEKRMYMTATPRLYHDDAKKKAVDNDMILCSMDDKKLYGEEFYHIGFGEAVNKGLLSDYKVLVLTVNENDMTASAQEMVAKGQTEIPADDVNKLIGCVNALSKEIIGDFGLVKSSDPEPMCTAVAFCQSIKVSKQITNTFNQMGDLYYKSLSEQQQAKMVTVESDHIDGTMAATTRGQKLSWLKTIPKNAMQCRVLTNVRCLSEGVDVPSLDAVMFLSARNSQVDVVQSVGRVMRRALGKKYGYIIIPIVVPSDVQGEKALGNNADYAVVWTVLNALRAHDDRFKATINKLELNKNKPASIVIGGASHGKDDNNGTEHIGNDTATETALQLAIGFDQMQSLLYAKLVEKVGERRYWEQWAKDVADIATRQIENIKQLVAVDKTHQHTFENFIEGLRKNINPSISEADAIEMLAQHLITQPVFEALFEDYSFVKNNAISQSMEQMLNLLEEHKDEKDTEILQKFYDSVRERASGIDNAEAKQKIIIELYDKFFRTAFPLMVERLGIVYTPVEVVDYIIHSVDAVLRKEFGRTLSDENLHILDPFTGTGTFITRLLQSGLIQKEDLQRKYAHEIHANELVLLAYYIASVNIENVYHDLFLTPQPPLQNGEGCPVGRGEERTVEVHIPPQLLENARGLRKNQTEAEEMLWQLLRGRKLNNLKFRRQHPLSAGFILDFYCAEAKLGIEIDGGYHNEIEQKEYDEQRTEVIKQYGINIIRFTNEDVINNTFEVLQKIAKAALSPLHFGEGAGGEEKYVPFDGICLTDTFQLGETKAGENLFSEMFPQNSERVRQQQKTPLMVIMGNPPYSIGQKSANDNAQNQNYPKLDKRIEETYAKASNAGLNKSLYDAYIKAFRWSADRLGNNDGVIAFVSNGAWLDGNSTDGFRQCLEQEFSAIYVFNLRGNQRTSGELSRKEGGKIFGSGSRTPIAITLLVKKKK
jgi:predicted helicase